MGGKREYPAEWLRVPAVVFACLIDGELRIMLNASAQRDVPIELVPAELRLPNTKLWVQLNESLDVEFVTARDE